MSRDCQARFITSLLHSIGFAIMNTTSFLCLMNALKEYLSIGMNMLVISPLTFSSPCFLAAAVFPWPARGSFPGAGYECLTMPSATSLAPSRMMPRYFSW